MPVLRAQGRETGQGWEIPHGSLDKSIAAFRNPGSSLVEWVAFGDSTFAGQDAVLPGYSPLTRLRAALINAGLADGGHGVVNGAIDTPYVSGEPSDAGQTLNAGFADTGSFALPGEGAIDNPGTAGNSTTIVCYGKQIRLLYLAFTLGGRFSYEIDGGGEVTVDPAYPASGFYRYGRIVVNTGVDGKHTVVIRNKGGRLVGTPTYSTSQSAAGTGGTLATGTYEYAAAFKTTGAKVGPIGATITVPVTLGQHFNFLIPGQQANSQGVTTNIYRRVQGVGNFKLIGSVATNGSGQYGFDDTGAAAGVDYAQDAAPVLESAYSYVNAMVECVKDSGIVIHNMAVRGSQSSYLTDQNLALGLGLDVTVDPGTDVLTRSVDASSSARHPVLVSFAHGMNDQQALGTTTALYTNTKKGIRAAKNVGADVIVFIPALETASSPGNAPGFRAALKQAAREERVAWVELGQYGALPGATSGSTSNNPHLPAADYATQGLYAFTKLFAPHLPPAAPANTAVPVISGTAKTGFTVTSSTGTFTGFPDPTYTYVWKRNGTAITGATSSTYQLQAADEGTTVTVTVTATNGAGSASATSAGISPVAPFAPTSITGLQLWLDASQISGVTTDGSAVASWTDMSGNARHATQATSGSQPVLKTAANGINGSPVVRFDGVDDWLKTASFTTISQPITAFIIYKPIAHPTGSTRSIVAEAAGFDRIAAHTTGGNLTISAGSNLFSSQFLTLGTPRIIRCVVNGASSSMTFNNGVGTTTTTGNAGANTFVGGLNIGGENGAGFAPNSDVAEVIVYNAALTGPQIAQVENYLSEKYGIAIA